MHVALSFHTSLPALVFAGGMFCAGAGQALAGYVQTNLVSDIAGLAIITDPLLVNPWGISRSPTSRSGRRIRQQIPAGFTR